MRYAFQPFLPLLLWLLAFVAGAQPLGAQTTASPKQLCRQLRQQNISPAALALPTRGVEITSARHESGHNGFCELRGEIRSVDPAANPIRFELNLPDHWNGKALQYGGGTFDGYIQRGLNHTEVGDRRLPIPLEEGYATFGSDSGHHHHYLFVPDVVNSLRARFALNEEERLNFASGSLKKTHDAAMALLKTRYAQVPRRMYFIGGSTGGREAMTVVDRWPEDYDGVLAAYAAWNTVEGDLQFIRVSRALYGRGPDGQSGWLPRRATKLLAHAVMNSCDAADGLRDGIISDTADCHFDPATLRCPDGQKHHGCLSDGQERTVLTFATPQVSDFTVANGLTTEPGYNVLRGADLSLAVGLFSHPMKNPFIFANSFSLVISDAVLRFFLTGNPDYNALQFDPRTASDPAGPSGRWVAGLRQNSAEDDATLADLTPFEQHGGKLLIVHGTTDTVIPTDGSVLLYQRIVAAMGQQTADRFARLYLVPGLGHGFGRFDAGLDTVGILDAWADGGQLPVHLVASDNHRGTPRTRPLCAWPSWPRFQSGNPRASESFVCTAPAPAVP